MALHRPPPAPGQRVEPPLQALEQLGRAHRRHPRGGQLDRQRHTVQAPADLHHRRSVLHGQREVGVHRAGPLHEQPHRVGLGQRPRGPASGAGEGSDGTGRTRSPSTASPSRLVAKTTSPAQSRSQGLDQLGHRLEQMLTVVQHHQQLLGAQKRGQRLLQGHPRAGTDPEHGGQRAGHPVRGRGSGPAPPARPPPGTGAAPGPPPATPAGSCPPRPPRSASPPGTRPAAATTRATSRSRPMNELTCNGRFPGNASRVRSGGNRSAGRDGPAGRARSGRPKSRSRCSPSASSSTPSGSRPPTSGAVAPDTSTWPP